LNKLHALSDILSMALIAIVSGADDWETVEDFCCDKEERLRQFLPRKNGIPSHDTFARVFSRLDAKAFEVAFFEWASVAVKGTEGMEPVRHLALDGKTVRGSRSKAGRALHLLHAWACEQGVLVLHKRWWIRKLIKLSPSRTYFPCLFFPALP
jgi:hypothetical protein